VAFRSMSRKQASSLVDWLTSKPALQPRLGIASDNQIRWPTTTACASILNNVDRSEAQSTSSQIVSVKCIMFLHVSQPSLEN
jgi:hypothetical protein